MKTFITYVTMLIPSFLAVSLAWSFTVSGRLYVCTDPIPVLDWLPEHVHTSKETYYLPLDEQYGTDKDHYLAPKWVVDTLWWFSCGLIFVLAGIATKVVTPLRGQSRRHQELFLR